MKLDVGELKKYTKYIGGFSASDSKIKMFWQMVEKDFNEDE